MKTRSQFFKHVCIIFISMSWAGIAAIILGALLLKAIFDPNTNINRCPYCNLVLRNNQTPCPRCKKQVDWD